MTSKIAQYLPISANINYIRARVLRQSKLNEHIIIDSKVGDDHRSLAENLMAHALSGQWPFG
jgi:L-rhamnose isomerase